MFNTDIYDLNINNSLFRLCPKLMDNNSILHISNYTSCIVNDNIDYYNYDITNLLSINKIYDYSILDIDPFVNIDIKKILNVIENISLKGTVVFYNSPKENLNDLGYVTETQWLNNKIINIVGVKFKELFSPWFTKAANAYIHKFMSNNINCRIFEFGCGRSTIWFNQFTNNIISVDHSFEWAKKVRESCNADVRLMERPYNKIITKQNELFDLISVDGRDRVLCVKDSVEKLAPNGIFILDDSNRVGYNEAVSLLNSKFGNGLEFEEDRKTTIWVN